MKLKKSVVLSIAAVIGLGAVTISSQVASASAYEENTTFTVKQPNFKPVIRK